MRALAKALERKIWVFELFYDPRIVPEYRVPQPSDTREAAALHCLNCRNYISYDPSEQAMRQKEPLRLLFSGDHFTPFLRCSDGEIPYELDLAIRDHTINPHPAINGTQTLDSDSTADESDAQALTEDSNSGSDSDYELASDSDSEDSEDYSVTEESDVEIQDSDTNI